MISFQNGKFFCRFANFIEIFSKVDCDIYLTLFTDLGLKF